MKRNYWILLLVVFGAGLLAEPGHARIDREFHGSVLRNADVDFEDGTLVIRFEGNRDVVEITESYDLHINHDKIPLNGRQRKLTEKYYESMQDLVEEACRIGMWGAEIGIEGAKLGLKAVAGVFRVLLTEFDEEDLERELEREERRIERQAERLEEEADEIEEMADDLKRLHREMRRSIPELRDLDWF